MALKWSKTSEGKGKTTFLIYGLPGAGKTWLCRTLPATAESRVLYVGVDPGQLVLKDKGYWSVKPESKADLDELFFQLRGRLDPSTGKWIPGKCEQGELDWVVVDGLDDAADLMLEHYKATLTTTGGKPDVQNAYGKMAETMAKWIKAMRDLPNVNVLFITHIEETMDKNGEMRFRPSFPGKVTHKDLVNWFDFVGCVRFKSSENDPPARMIQFKGEAGVEYTVKERGYGEYRLSDWEVPDMTAIFKKLGLSKEKKTNG